MKLRLPPGTKRKVQSGRQAQLTKKHRNGAEEVLREESSSETHETTEGPATAGISMGLTIPGPKGSFMAARCDAWVSVPCGNTDGEIRAAYRRASEIAQEQLEKDAELVSSFFDSL